MTPSGIEPATFRLVARYLNRLRHSVHTAIFKHVPYTCMATFKLQNTPMHTARSASSVSQSLHRIQNILTSYGQQTEGRHFFRLTSRARQITIKLGLRKHRGSYRLIVKGCGWWGSCDTLLLRSIAFCRQVWFNGSYR